MMTSRTFFLWFLLILLSSSLLAGPDEERAKQPLPSTSKDRAALEQARKAREEEQHRKALEQLKAAALGTPAPKRDAWQEGDSHAAALNGYLDDAITARTALARSCEQVRPAAEVAQTMDVFADKLDTLYAGIAQFCSWFAVTQDPVKFSDAGLAQAKKFCVRLDEFDSSLPQLDAAFGPYQNDPAIIPSENRILSSITGMKKILSRLGLNQN
jgi:hypothetical protein